MIALHRLATPADAPRLHALRRRSILELAPSGISAVAAETWAGALTSTGMKRKLRELEIWVAEVDGRVVAWGAIRGAVLEGLYTDPEFAGRGIGTALLAFLEALMRERGIAAVRADASRNAEAFYYRRGYEPDGPRTPKDAQPIRKRLSVDRN
jgi:putative acetyltransferase